MTRTIIQNRFRILNEGIFGWENRISCLVGLKTHPTIVPRSGIKLTTSRLHSFNMAKVFHAFNHSATKTVNFNDVFLTAVCRNTEVRCMEGKCIEKTWVCDGHDDCEGGTDETGCRKSTRRLIQDVLKSSRRHIYDFWGLKLHYIYTRFRARTTKSGTLLRVNDRNSGMIQHANETRSGHDFVGGDRWKYGYKSANSLQFKNSNYDYKKNNNNNFVS